MYEYRATMVKAIDGDTYDLDVDLGFYLQQRMRLRLLGVDTPEIRGVPAAERERGLAALALVQADIPPGTRVLINTTKTDSFGRYLATLRFVPGVATPTDEQLRAGTDLTGRLVEWMRSQGWG